MSRRAVVDVLNRIAFAAELAEGLPEVQQSLRPEVYSRAAWSIRSAEGDFEELASSGRLRSLPGVGAAVTDIVERVLRGDEVPLLAELEAVVPAGLFEIHRVPGLGPKKIRTLWRELGVTTLGELEYACDENRLVELKGFGKKTQEKVKAAVVDVRKTEGHMRLDQVLELARTVLASLRAQPGVERAEIAGEVRRGRETLRSLDIVVLDASGGERPALDEMVRAHPCRAREAFGVAMLLATGSDEHVALVREHAGARGLALDVERGVIRRDGVVVPCPEEDDVYRALGLVPTAPERREAGVPLVLEGHAAPRLLKRADLVGALHNHTTASDGTATLEEMRAAAAALGLGYLAITEHSRAAGYAGGLDEARLRAQRDEIARLNAPGHSCVLLSGVESDILRDGALDYPAEVLRALDVVIASVHNRYSQKGDELTARMRAAAANPCTDVVGHPTGRLLLGRPPAEYDVAALLDECARAGCAVELNANPARLDLGEQWLALAKERGVLVSVAADAHSTDALAHLEYGVVIARRAGLSPDDVLNTRPLAELLAWIRERRATAAATAA